MTLRFRGKESRWALVGGRYQTIKGLTHIPIGVVCFLLTLSQPALTGEEKAHLLDLKKTIASAESEISAEGVGAEMVPVEHRLLGRTAELIDDVVAHGRPADERLHAYGKAIRADVDANLAGASGAFPGALDAAVHEMRAEVGAEAWPRVVAVITTAHQARAREVSVQYFERLLGEHLTEGALGEQRLVVLEGAGQQATAESIMTLHLVDQRVSALLFDDPLFLQGMSSASLRVGTSIGCFRGRRLDSVAQGWSATGRVRVWVARSECRVRDDLSGWNDPLSRWSDPLSVVTPSCPGSSLGCARLAVRITCMTRSVPRAACDPVDRVVSRRVTTDTRFSCVSTGYL